VCGPHFIFGILGAFAEALGNLTSLLMSIAAAIWDSTDGKFIARTHSEEFTVWSIG
jgi:hypothetical protein